MSLIADALKTAQREKELRESKGARLSAAAVLIPLKDPSAPFDAKRALWVVGASVAVIVAVLIIRESRQTARKSPALPAVASAILSEAIADSATPLMRAQPSPRVAQRGSVRPDGIVPIPRRAPSTSALAQAQATQAAGDTIAVLQGQSDSTRTAAAARPDTTGRLRIAV